MTEIEVDRIRKHWQLNASQLARVLCVHSNKMSEYLSGVTRIPCSLAMHIEVLQLLSDDTRLALFEQRLNRKAHE